MRYGEGASYGSGARFGRSVRGSTHYVISSGFHYFSMDYINSMLPELIVEKPVPPELAWTKMNTGWNKKRGRK